MGKILDNGEEASVLTKVIMKALNGFAGRIDKLCIAIDKIPTKLPEISAFLLYTVLHFIMCYFHEPWFDEAEAWQITKCASIKEIIFDIPHYEGHTPVWDFILMPWAKGGAPYELSLSIVSYIFAGLAVALILFKSPFKRIIKLLLPFTYFFFYQYGVICRPYCVMMLAFVLMGMSYKNRNSKPHLYVLSLMLLAITFPVGLVIAGGITLVWLIEVLSDTDISMWLKDKRLWWMFTLLAVAIVCIFQIMPREDTFATTKLIDEAENSLGLKLLYTFIALPSDLIVTNAWWDQGRLSGAALWGNDLITACVVGIIIWITLYIYGSKKKMLPMLVIPYSAYALFCSLVYMSNHHMGIALLFFVFWFWVASGEEAKGKDVLKNVSDRDRSALNSCIIIVAMCSILMSVWWTIASCATDIKEDYAEGRTEAKFIKENGLDKYNILAEYELHKDSEGNVIAKDMNYIYTSPNIQAYFDENPFYNMDKRYVEHRRLGEVEESELLERLKKIEPEVLFGMPDLELIYGSCAEYTLVYDTAKLKAWKDTYNLSEARMYVRDDLLEEIGLTEYRSYVTK